MPDFEIRRVLTGNRREGRRSLSAYGSHARGVRAEDSGVSGHSGGSGAEPWIALALGRHPTSRQMAVLRAPGWRSGPGLSLRGPWPNSARCHAGSRVEAAGWRRRDQWNAKNAVNSQPSHRHRRRSHRLLGAPWRRRALGRLRPRVGPQSARWVLLVQPDDPEIHHALFLLCASAWQTSAELRHDACRAAEARQSGLKGHASFSPSVTRALSGATVLSGLGGRPSGRALLWVAWWAVSIASGPVHDARRTRDPSRSRSIRGS